MFISSSQLEEILNRIDSLERQVESMQSAICYSVYNSFPCHSVYNSFPSRPVVVPHNQVLEAIIRHLEVEVTAMPPTKSGASIHFTNKNQPK
jgi:hypothetical protein